MPGTLRPVWIVVLVSVALGVGWNVLALWLMGGRLREALAPGWLLAGALAGLAAGAFTIWSRRRRDGGESFLHGLATYYLAIVVYWAGFVIVERALMCLRHGGWTAFDLRDHLMLIVTFVIYGTLWFGVLLIPLTFLSRHLIWRLYTRAAS